MADTTLPGLFATGDHASRPAASAVGSGGLYSCTTHGLVYQTDGSSWTTWATLGAAVTEITDIPTADTTTTNVLAPDGAGGVEWRAESGGGFVQAATATRTAGDLTTASTSFVDATGLTVTLTTGAHRCLVYFDCSVKNSGAANNTVADIAIDGTLQGGTYGLSLAATGTGSPLHITFLTAVLSAASHTIKVQWRVDAGTGTMWASAGVIPARLTVIETNLAS